MTTATFISLLDGPQPMTGVIAISTNSLSEINNYLMFKPVRPQSQEYSA